MTNLRSLTMQYQLCYAIIHRAGTLSGAKFHEQYDRLASEELADTCATPLSRRGRRDKLEKLEAYGLIERTGEGFGTEYSVVDVGIEPEVRIEAAPE